MSGKQLRVLIVEDSKQDAELLLHLLKKNDFDLQYQIIDSKEQMQEYLDKNTCDLVISDFKMPGFSGLEALKMAKKHEAMLPFILLSGFINQEQESEILENGANEVIMKDNLNRLPFAVRRVLHEVEDKKKLKKLVKTKDTLFSVLAHDLRGTLEGIHVLAETMKVDVNKPSAAESMQENLQMISQSARSTNQLLGNVLNWALMQVGTLKPSFKEIAIKDCVEKSIEIHESKAKRKNVKINYQPDSTKVIADENMLPIVFRNLIANAINYSNPGDEIIIDVKKGEEEVKVAVKDQGIGIPEDIKSKLFDPDNRPTRPGTQQEQSTGFGLLICKDVVKMHGGGISVKSKKGEGSTFVVTLPKSKQSVEA